MVQETTVTLDMGAQDVQASAIAVLEHCMIFPPKYASIEYNMGLGMLFTSLRQTLSIDHPHIINNENL